MSMSMAIGLMAQQNLIDGTALALLGLQWDFKGPVRIGDTIHAVVTPVQKRPTQMPGRGSSPCDSR
jgi:acyl dehydratase